MKPPKSMECPPTGEAAKPSSSRGFGDDSFRNYMSKKIDMQRKQFGGRLPPPPEPPPPLETIANEMKKTDLGVVGLPVQDEMDIGNETKNEKNLTTARGSITSIISSGRAMSGEFNKQENKNKRKKTDRVRFADDVKLDLEATSRPKKKKKKKSGMSSILKRLKQKHGEKNKRNPLERKRIERKLSKSLNHGIQKESTNDHYTFTEIQSLMDQAAPDSVEAQESGSDHNSEFGEIQSLIDEEVNNSIFIAREKTPQNVPALDKLEKFHHSDNDYDASNLKRSTGETMYEEHLTENQNRLDATKVDVTDGDIINMDGNSGDDDGDDDDDGSDKNSGIESSYNLHSSSRSDIISLRKQRPDLFFLGVVVLVNGYTNPDTSTIQRMLQRHGGDLEKYETSRITHIIAEHLSTAKADIYKRQRRPTPVCNPRWIVDCVEARRLLPHADYLIQEVQDENVGSKTVKTFFSKAKTSTSTKQNSIPSTHSFDEMTKTDNLDHNCLEIAYSKSSTNSTTMVENNRITKAANVNTNGLCDEDKEGKVQSENEVDQKPAANSDTVSRDSKSTEQVAKKASVVTGKPRTVGTDPNFLESYFSTSRLSFIGTFKQRARTSPIKKGYMKSDTSRRLVFHVDMDCFFVAVVLRNYPEHKNKPVAISHHGKTHEKSGSKKSRSECATCSYEARKYGVKKGMFLGRARELCPDLIVLPYDFDGYEEVSSQVADILYRQAEKYDGSVEEVSCDEAYMELFVPQEVEPKSLAEQIRAEIFSATQCTASVGVANNKLLSKLGTDRAKPNNSYVVGDFRKLLEELNLRDLHGVGYRLDRKLQMENLVTVRDVWDLGDSAEGELSRVLGPGLGKKIFLACKGEDERPVKPAERKTIGAECNYGVRFDGPYGVDYMVQGLVQEVHKRMEGVGVRGSRLTLKVKQRKEGALPPGKFLGHGSCHNHSKSCDTSITRDWKIFKRSAMKLFEELDVPKDDIRGMGIVISKLSHDKRGEADSNSEGQLTSFFQSVPSGTTDLKRGSTNQQSLKPIHETDVPESNSTVRELFTEDNLKDFPETTNECEKGSSFTQDEREKIAESTAAGTNVASMPSPVDTGLNSHFLPSMSQIDRDVLKELPLEIREEVIRELGSGSTLPSEWTANTDVSSGTMDLDTAPANFEEEIIEVDERKPEAEIRLSNVDESADQASSPEHQLADEVALPPSSQIHMSQVMALPSPLRKQVVSKMGLSSNDHAHLTSEEVEMSSSPTVARRPVRKKPRKKVLELKKRANLVFDNENSHLKQASVKRMLKLAAVKTGEETLENSYGDGLVSLTQLETLPLEVQLQVANNDICNIGHQSPKIQQKHTRRSFEAAEERVIHKEVESSVGLTGVAGLSTTDEDCVSSVEQEPLITNHTKSIDLAEDDNLDDPPPTGSFYHDNVLPLRLWMDEHIDGSQNDIDHVKDFLGICIEEVRIEDAITFLRSIKSRQDFWGNNAYEDLLNFVVEKARPVIDGTLDVEWLGLVP